MKQYLSETDVARILNLSVVTIRNWRTRGRGPCYHKIGGVIRYDPDELRRYIEQCRMEPCVKS